MPPGARRLPLGRALGRRAGEGTDQQDAPDDDGRGKTHGAGLWYTDGLPPSLHMERQYDDPRRRTLRMRWSPPICMSTSVAPPERGWRSMMMRPPYRRPTGRLAPTLGDSVRGWDTPQATTSRLAGSPHSDILQKGTVVHPSGPGWVLCNVREPVTSGGFDEARQREFGPPQARPSRPETATAILSR